MGTPFQLTDFGLNTGSEYSDHSPDGRSLAVDACPGDVQGIFVIPAESKTGMPVRRSGSREPAAVRYGV